MKIVNRQIQRLFASVLCLCLFLSSLSGVVFSVSAKEEQKTETGSLNKQESASNDTNSYFSYYHMNEKEVRPQQEALCSSPQAFSETVSISSVEERSSVILRQEQDWAEWTFTITEGGMYSLYTVYYPLTGTGKNIEFSVSIDGVIPYKEAETMTLPRIWTDHYENETGTFEKDLSGNEMRPEQVEMPCWNEKALADVLGMYGEPYLFYLAPGAHTVRLTYGSEPFAVAQLSFKNAKEPIPYAEYIAGFSQKDYADGEVIRQEAEKTYSKNSNMLYPANDRSDAGSYPSDPFYVRLNTVGGSSWSKCGDAISWQAAVEREGLYQLSFRTRQNFSDGMNAYRRLYINGEIPFKEAEKVTFEYKSGWYVKTLGDKDPVMVYLRKGDIITLECTSGEMAFPLREIQQAVLELNEIYRDIIMVTGPSPSIYQDYNLEDQLPDLVTDLKDVCIRLNSAADAIYQEMGKDSAGAATIVKAVMVFEELAKDPFFIPDRLSSFKTNIESLASLLLSLGGQALELDCIYYVPADAEAPTGKTGLFTSIGYALRRLIATFTEDYNGIGAFQKDGKFINVWAGLGRDQAQIVNRLIEESFTLQTGIGVKLSLVSGDGTLIKATLAGKGPDVSLTVGYTTPINLAARGALVDLTQFDLSKLRSEIYPSAWTLFEYQNGIYAIPETQSCDLLFYRTDIFESLQLSVPNTWEEFYHVLEILQSKRLQVAWPEINSGDQGNSFAVNVFNKFLFQNGGDYYNEALSETLFETEAAYQAFERTVELYRTFSLSRDINVFNRFRSGEAPLAISTYSLYTQLLSSAPEIRGLWGFAQIPGTRKEDGSIDRTDGAPANGCVMMQTAVKRNVEKEAFAFLEWWTGSSTQTAYGKEVEGILGAIGRITPANAVALKNLGWSEEEYAIIDSQLRCSKNPPQVVGNYQVARSLTSAIRAAINDENTPRRALQLYNKDINAEISRKRKEFHLD